MRRVEKDATVRFELHAKPRAKMSKVVGERGDALEVALAAPPVEGAANEELVHFLARVLAVPRRDAERVRGQGSREKLVASTCLTLAALEARLRAAVVVSDRA